MPGEAVRLSGRLASPLRPHPGYGDFCWDGCRGGLDYDGVQLTWPSPTTFTAQLTLPNAPWVVQGAGDGPRLVSPVAGTYPLGVQCLLVAKGCGLDGPEGQTTVRLRGSARYTCKSVPGCARLSGPAVVVHPGQLVQFRGDAPLESIIGSRFPFAYQLTAGTNRPTGPGVVFIHLGKGGVGMDSGAAPVNVATAVPFSSLKGARPLSEIAAGAAPISANPGDLAYVGWCTPGFIDVQGPTGRSQVPLTGAIRLLASTGDYQAPLEDRCDDLAFAGASPGPDFAAFAAFEVAPINQAPMVAEVALVTTDAGRSWSFVPTPPGAKPTSFGGFRYVGGDVDALFSNTAAASESQSTPPLVEQTTDGGKSWGRTPFSCPATGPCVTFAAHMPGNCAQGLDSQAVITSVDQGRRWSGPSWPGALVTCWLTTLEATSPDQAILVTSNTFLASVSPFDALMTSDGGRTWQVVYLPPLPSSLAGPPPEGPGDVVVLPDGGLLSVDASPWQLLAPGSGAWCRVRTPGPGPAQTVVPLSFTVIGDSLWWLSGTSSGTAVTAHDLASTSLTCGP